MSKSVSTNLVGAHFRPPAKALLAILPADHPLWLRPEPSNDYDENAVQVLVLSDSIRDLAKDEFWQANAEGELGNQGFALDEILAEPEWHLGYLPKAAKGNAELEAWNVQLQKAIHTVAQALPDGTFPLVAAFLAFDSAGKPTVSIPWPPTAEGISSRAVDTDSPSEE